MTIESYLYFAAKLLAPAYDLKASITADNTYTSALTGGSSDHAWFSSSEGVNPPQLVLTP